MKNNSAAENLHDATPSQANYQAAKRINRPAHWQETLPAEPKLPAINIAPKTANKPLPEPISAPIIADAEDQTNSEWRDDNRFMLWALLLIIALNVGLFAMLPSNDIKPQQPVKYSKFTSPGLPDSNTNGKNTVTFYAPK
jgi:hypothetical protein